MIASTGQSRLPAHEGVVPKVKRYTGDVVYLYAFDVAYEMARQPVLEILGQPVAQFAAAFLLPAANGAASPS